MTPSLAPARTLVGRLAALAADEGETRSISPRSQVPLSWPVRAVLAVAILKIASGLVALGIAFVQPLGAPGITVGPGLILLQLFMYGGVGFALLAAHAHDARTVRLGVVLVVISSTFSNGLVAELIRLMPMLSWLLPLHPDAFLALCFAQFVREFPRTTIADASDRWIRALVVTSLAAGIWLFSANIIASWTTPAEPWAWALSLAQRRSTTGTIYWTLTFGLMFVALALAVWRTRLAPRDERRRVRLFLAGFLAGLGPTVVFNVLTGHPALGARLAQPSVVAWLIPTLRVLLATVPCTVAYAVLVRRLLPVRLVIRKALGYALARWTIGAAFAAPVLLLLLHGYRFRNETVATAMGGRMLWMWAAIALAGVVSWCREALLRTVDRWFFREAYDARNVLTELVGQSRRADRVEDLVALLTAGIDRALRPESVAVVVRDERGEHFVSLFGTTEPLPTSAVLAQVLERTRKPLDVDLANGLSPLRLLPRPERQWLADAGARLLVSLRASDGSLVGVIALGERKSELPFSDEDRRLLTAIADAGAMTVEHHAMRASVGPEGRPSAQWGISVSSQGARAAECERCGGVQPAADVLCERCGTDLTPSQVPRVLHGKFRFEQRVGRGGMGVVYRAVDLNLDRVVAVKTLPDTSPEHSQRLRNEARAMAALAHRNLAVVYGAESWHGKPLLICEFMTHGTLADRLRGGPLPIREGLGLGVELAEGLGAIHAAGFLHRDVKPSNIGYGAGEVPKMLDFGLVHILTRPFAASTAEAPLGATDELPSSDLARLTRTHALIGTPLYLSPEATTGTVPSAAFDLWSLNVLLLEAITGQHPFLGRTVEETLDRIRNAQLDTAVGPLRLQSPRLASYFERALARDVDKRPRSAADVADDLRVELERAIA